MGVKMGDVINNSIIRTRYRFILFISVFIFGLVVFMLPAKAEAAFNASYIIPDDQFIAISSMTENQIQEFLVAKGGSLATYVETKDSWIGPNSYQYPTGCPSDNCVNAKGMKASAILYKVANWYGLNPQVILVTLQKEQSLITLPLSLPDDQWRLNSAMGYGCPDSGGCSDAYKSFSLQTDWASWQLRWNMDKANSQDTAQRAKVAPYYTGNTITIDGVATLIGNGATASLYRYTPHFHGNENFYSIYSSWFMPYLYEFVSAINPPSNMSVGARANVSIILKNVGSATWKSDEIEKTSPFRMEILSGSSVFYDSATWIEPTRIKMTTTTVAPGEMATFDFCVKANSNPGYYVMKLVPTVENVVRLPDYGMTFGTNIPEWLSYELVSTVYPPATLSVGSTANVKIVLKNKGSAAWLSDKLDPSFRPFRLEVISGASSFYDSATWIGPARIKMTNDIAGYNQLATFNFSIKAPTIPGNYSMRMVPVIENLSRFKDIGMNFKVTVPQKYLYELVSAINPPSTMLAGAKADVRIILKNTGSVTWKSDEIEKTTPFRLEVISGASSFYDSATWIEPTRIKMTTATVAPGEMATFDFTLKASSNLGTYCMRFLPTLENVSRFADIGMVFTVKVN